MELWHSGRATAYGAAIGVVAAAFKLFAPWSEPHTLLAIVEEVLGAALSFALLCGVAAALRNLIVRRLISPNAR
jgi:ethanolamine utilization protein EutA (predicted chaperonin)